MQKVLLTPFWLIAATFIGLGDTLYLSYYKWLDIIPACAVGGCEIVLTHPLSEFFGVPLAYLGLVYYAYMLALVVLLAIEPHSRALRLATLAYAGTGLLCSIAFELLQIFVIGALCLYCGISALTTLALFAIALWHWKLTK
jgi:uncharacterized membrane protein